MTGQGYKWAEVAEVWDAIVIGSGIGGLTPAALLARAGWRVLVLERHSTAGGCTHVFRRKGYEWDVGLHYVGQVHRRGSNLNGIFHDLTGGRLEWASMPDVYNQIVIGNNSYDIVSGPERFRDCLVDYFPAERLAIDRYMGLIREVSQTARPYFAERAMPQTVADPIFSECGPAFHRLSDRTTLEVLREITENPELIAVLTGHYGDLALPPSQSSFAAHALLVSHYLHGAAYPVGGSGRIAENIEAVVAAAGGALLTAAEVTAIQIVDGHAEGVQMADGRVFRAPVVVSDAGIANTLTRLLPPEIGAAAGLVDACGGLPASLCAVVLNIGLKIPADQLGMSGTNIWFHPTNDYDGNLSAFLADPERAPLPMSFYSFPSAKDPTWSERYPGRSTLDLCTFAQWALWKPFANSSWRRRDAAYEALKSRIADRVWADFLRFAPHLAGAIDYLEVATPLSFNHFLARNSGDFMGFALTPARLRQRWMRAHSPIPGLFFTGQDVASCGVSGAVAGGLLAASAVLGRDVNADIASRRKEGL